MTTSDRNLPLTGIRVLELGHTVMGPTCGMILADLGAEVYKVEPIGDGDPTRSLGGFGSAFFPCFNRNKQSLSLDLKASAGRNLFLDLVATADILIENYAPGTMERLGLDYPSCSKRNQGLIYCSLKGFMPGPYAHRPALDEVVQMMGGLAYMTGPTGQPLRAGSSITDIFAGSFGVIGILTALHERTTTGKGKHVQSTLFESVAFLVSQHIGVAAISGTPPPPMPERGRAWAIYDLFTTADNRQVFVGITSEQQWQRMCSAFGFQDWANDRRLASNQDRINARERLLPALAERFAGFTEEQLLATADRARIPCAPVNQPMDLVNDPHLLKTDGLVAVQTPNGKTAMLPRIPLQMNGAGFPLRSQPPAVGNGTRAVCRALGLPEEEIEQLISTNVIEVDD